MQVTIGIDISKAWFDVAILREGQPPGRKRLANKLSGFSEFNLWVASLQATSVTVAMEATGSYGERLALFCVHLGWRVFVLNPARIKAYGVALGQRNKTDRADALTIARFAQSTPGLTPWAPPSPAQALLRELVRERLHTQDLLLAEEARAATAGASAREFIAARVELLRKQIKDLMGRIRRQIQEDARLNEDSQLISSIAGVGPWTAAVLLSELPPVDKKTSARKIAALFGLCPRNVESGSSVRGPARLGGQGRRRISHQLYMPALCALKHNELIMRWADGLRQRGKVGKEVLCAVIHRLMRIVVGVLKTRRAFDPSWKGAHA